MPAYNKIISMLPLCDILCPLGDSSHKWTIYMTDIFACLWRNHEMHHSSDAMVLDATTTLMGLSFYF